MNFLKIIPIFILFFYLIIFTNAAVQSFSGMRLTVQEVYPTSLENDTTLYDLVNTISKNPNVVSSDYSLKTSTYNIDTFDISYVINSSSYHLLTQNPILNIFTYSQGANTLRCSAIPSSPNCILTYTTSEERSPYNRYKFHFEVCNIKNYCWSVGEKLSLYIIANKRESTFSGMRLFLNLDSYEPSFISYITPTPPHKTKSTSTSFTIKISDGTFNLTWANVSINNINYSMTEGSTLKWNYTYTNSSITTPVEYIFKVYTAEGELEQRKITLYPDKNSNQNFPAISIFSLFVSLVFIFYLL